MADSSVNGLTSLARALSQPTLDLLEANDVSPPRSLQLHPGRRIKLSSCNSIENAEQITSPCSAEARVLVINTGGTIGMTLHDDGSYGNHWHHLFHRLQSRSPFLSCCVSELRRSGSFLLLQNRLTWGLNTRRDRNMHVRPKNRLAKSLTAQLMRRVNGKRPTSASSE